MEKGNMPEYPVRIKFTKPGGGGNGGGLDIHHRGVGGGTKDPITDLPLYNYEDHDLFNTSWMWDVRNYWLYTNHPGCPDWYSDWGMMYVDRTNGHILEFTGCPINSTRTIFLLLVHYFFHDYALPVYHFMTKSLIFGWTQQNGTPINFAISIGYFYVEGGIIVPGPNPNWGIGFGYSPILCPNPNFYVYMSKNGAFIYLEDTGIPINQVTPHKFNVVLHHHYAEFYIDDILTNVVTQADHPLEWPHDIDGMSPQVGVTNLETEGQSIVAMEYKLPWIASIENTYEGPDEET